MSHFKLTFSNTYLLVPKVLKILNSLIISTDRPDYRRMGLWPLQLVIVLRVCCSSNVSQTIQGPKYCFFSKWSIPGQRLSLNHYYDSSERPIRADGISLAFAYDAADPPEKTRLNHVRRNKAFATNTLPFGEFTCRLFYVIGTLAIRSSPFSWHFEIQLSSGPLPFSFTAKQSEYRRWRFCLKWRCSGHHTRLCGMLNLIVDL